MKYIILSTTLLIASINLMNARVNEFTGRNDKMIVLKGDTVVITSDTAFIINKQRAQKLNYQLDELDTIKLLYNGLLDDRNDLISEISKTQKFLNKLLTKLKQDSTISSNNLDLIINDLDQTLNELKKNNKSLKITNQELNKQVSSLKNSVKDLKKETKWIWWNGAADKIIAFVGGIGVGILVGTVL